MNVKITMDTTVTMDIRVTAIMDTMDIMDIRAMARISILVPTKSVMFVN